MMLKPIFGLLFAMVLLVGVTSVRAAEPVHVIMYQLEHRLDLNGTKPYNKVAEQVFAGLGDAVELDIIPMARGISLWGKNHRSCAFPANPGSQGAFSDGAELVSSIPLDIVSVRVYLPAGSAELTSLTELTGKRTAYIRGSIAGKLIEPYGVVPTEVTSEEQLIGMLRRGRVDAFLGFHPDTAIALDDFGPGLLKVSKVSVEGMRLPVGVVCFRFPGVDELIEQINLNIIRLHQSGRLEQVLSTHAELPDDQELQRWIDAADQRLTN